MPSFRQGIWAIPFVMVLLFAGTPLEAQRIEPELTGPSRSPESSTSLRDSIRSAKNSVYPALINISLVKRQYQNGQVRRYPGGGSGVILTSDGYALTNYHVANQAEQIRVTLSNQHRVDARLVGKDALTDLAVLKLDESQLPDGTDTFPHADLGSSRDVEVGDYVLAMGNPWMMAQSVTLGIVSNNNRVFFSREGSSRIQFGGDLKTGMFTEWIQHDASISPGSSGGPLVNLDGEVIGINARGAQLGGDMGFAIPSDQADRVMEILIEQGEIARSWIGIQARATQETGVDSGVLINAVTDPSPAHRAGLRPGDVVTAINGRSVNVRFTEQLARFYRRLASVDVGGTVHLTVRRDTRTVRPSVVTKKRRNREGTRMTLKRWGMNIQELTPFDRRRMDQADSVGVRIANIRSGGPASKATPPLQSGDILLSVNGRSVDSLSSLETIYESGEDTATNSQLLEVSREGDRLLTVLKPEAPRELVQRASEMDRAWIGIKTQVLTESIRNQLNRDIPYGVRVTRVYEGTNAAESELKVGDVIRKIGDQPVRTKFDYQQDVFRTAVGRMSINSRKTLEIVRDTTTIKLDVTLETAPARAGDVPSYKENTFDFVVREATFYDHVNNGWSEGTEGVVVKSTESGGWAGLGGLKSGDLITSIGGKPIGNIRDVRRVMESVIDSKPERLHLNVRRDQESRYLIIKPEWNKMSSNGSNNHE